MLSLRSFRITFDEPHATYKAGDIVTGKIIVDLTREKVMRGLIVYAKGEAKVRWIESKYETYLNREEYFNFATCLVGSQASDSRVSVRAGVHKYCFKFRLPYSIPSSIEHKNGYIRYTLKAVIDRPWKFNHECKAAFTVIMPLDLNTYQSTYPPIDDEVSESFCCCFANNGGIDFHVRTPTSGYVPGQSINTVVEYINYSPSVSVVKICAKLVQVLKLYLSPSNTKSEKTESKIATIKDVGPFTARGHHVLNLSIPPIPPSNLEFCNITDLNYKLTICIHTTGLHCKIEKEYPILIGTVPKYYPSSGPLTFTDSQSVQGFTRVSSSGEVDSGLRPLCPEQPEDASSETNKNITPPTYEECPKGTKSIKDKGETNYIFGVNDSFKPRYPVFDYPTLCIRD